jgi:hypothetical protein
MSTQHEITINVVSSSSVSPDEEAELRSALETSAGPNVLKALAHAWKAENSGERMAIEMPEGKGVVSENLKFKELEFFKDLIGEVLQVDDDRKVVIRLEDDQLSSNRVTELYAVLVFLGSLVGGWEEDSEFSWNNPSVGTSAFFWEGDGQIFPESDFN